jgi:hypothetical protein
MDSDLQQLGAEARAEHAVIPRLPLATIKTRGQWRRRRQRRLQQASTTMLAIAVLGGGAALLTNREAGAPVPAGDEDTLASQPVVAGPAPSSPDGERPTEVPQAPPPAGSDAPTDPANPSPPPAATTDPGESPAPEPTTAPPNQAPPAPPSPSTPPPTPAPVLATADQRVWPSAALTGTIVISDGCVRFRPAGSAVALLAVWRSGHEVVPTPNGFQVRSPEGVVLGGDGAVVSVGGGVMPVSSLAGLGLAGLTSTCPSSGVVVIQGPATPSG